MIKTLLIDDDLEMRECVGGYLKSRSFTVTCAKTGEEALKIIKENTPDCVLLDIHLPEGMSGMELLKKIKEFNSNIKVLMITGFIDHEKESECMKLGADAYIMKPINFPELDSTIKNSVDKK